jgi:hypothetical protein
MARPLWPPSPPGACSAPPLGGRRRGWGGVPTTLDQPCRPPRLGSALASATAPARASGGPSLPWRSKRACASLLRRALGVASPASGRQGRPIVSRWMSPWSGAQASPTPTPTRPCVT